jgi:hypothetical protein
MLITRLVLSWHLIQARRHKTDILQIAMNLFTDNVPTLVVQAQIIREVPNILCPTAVFSMDADIIKRIAGETQEKIDERDAILRRLTILEKGARICKQYAKRPHSCKISLRIILRIEAYIFSPQLSIK